MSSPSDFETQFAAMPVAQITSLYQLSQAIITFARLGLAEQLQTQGPTGLEALAAASHADPKLLGQLLGIAHGVGLVTLDADQRYALTDKGRDLCPDTEQSTRFFVAHHDDGYAPWGALQRGLQGDGVPFEMAHGCDIFSYLKTHPEQNRYFNQFMEVTTAHWLADTGHHYPFAGHLVDLGGNTGTLTATLLRQFPTLRATLFDLAQAVEQAPAIIDAAGVSDRCAIVTGSFFVPAEIPTDGDLYLFSRVLLNWDDAQVVNILRNCRQAMPADSRLLILDFVLPESPGVGTLLGSLNLWVMFGARSRSRREFEDLVAEAGFVSPRWIPIASESGPTLFLLEATPTHSAAP